MTDAAALGKLAVQVAEDAGDLVVRRRAEGVSVAATKSTPTDVVTAADREAEEFIRGRLLQVRPDDAILGEEGGRAAGTSGVTWVIDPIDGTVNYLYGIPSYSVSIAAEVDGVVEAGAVVNPVSAETFAAVRGGGATLNGQPIAVSGATELDRSLVGTGFGYAIDRRAAQAAVLNHVIVKVRDIRRAGSAALDLCAVACGRLDGYYERGLNHWDLAAGALIAQEAGARVGGANGVAPSDELTVAAAPAIFDDLHDLLLAAGADHD
jgi:myo-inositol-1(or 4)-monophosphatase